MGVVWEFNMIGTTTYRGSENNFLHLYGIESCKLRDEFLPNAMIIHDAMHLMLDGTLS